MKRQAFSFILFAVMTAAFIFLVRVMNWLPLLLEPGTLRDFRSVEDATSALRIQTIYVPTYFPQTIAWPPGRVVGQSKPFIMVLMTFRERNSTEDELVITQSESDALPGSVRESFSRIDERVPYLLHGRQAVLEVGVCRTEEPCSRLTWHEGRYRLSVFMRSAPFELIKIAESMLR